MQRINRRLVLAGGAALVGLSPALAFAARLPVTAAQTEGPFYPDVMPLENDADLVRIQRLPHDSGGQILELGGRVIDVTGAPVDQAIVEIWQVDATGHYIHTRDRAPAGKDRYFQGIGRTLVGSDGSYRFRTIRPVPYPGRTPHIHFKVYRPGGPTLTTQMYLADEAGNLRDGIYRSLSPSERGTVTVGLSAVAGPDPAWRGRFDIVLG